MTSDSSGRKTVQKLIKCQFQDVYRLLARVGFRGGTGPGGRVHGAGPRVSGVPHEARDAAREAAAVLPAGDSESRLKRTFCLGFGSFLLGVMDKLVRLHDDQAVENFTS